MEIVMFITRMVRIIALSLGLATCITQPIDRVSWPKIDHKILKTSLIGSVAGACVYAISCLTGETPVKSSYALGTMGLFGLAGALCEYFNPTKSAQLQVLHDVVSAPGGVPSQVAIVPNHNTPKINKEILVDCAICMTQSKPYKLSCGHSSSCKECLGQMIEIAIRGRSTRNLKCSKERCEKKLAYEDINAIATPDQRKALEEIKTQEFLAQEKTIVHCPTPRCRAQYDTQGRGLSITCTQCNKTFCPKCKENHTDSISCTKVKANDAATKRFIEETTKPCPQCKTRISRIDGCNAVKCTQCNHTFCYRCGKARGDFEHENGFQGNRQGCRCQLFDNRPIAKK